MITINSVSKSFKSFKAIDSLDLYIRPNEYVALLGPNGAGKTTLVEMIEGLQFLDSGSITIQGKNWAQHSYALRKIMGLSLQETRFMDKQTVGETLNLFGSFYKIGTDRTDEILELINLQDKKDSYVVNLSGGQRQKLALGVALLNDPQVLLLDEPTSDLDPVARRELWDILMQLKSKSATTMILTTHYMEEAEYLCDRIVIMDQGKILADGTLNNLLGEFSAGEIISFELSKSIYPVDIDKLPGIIDIQWIKPYSKAIITVNSITDTMPILFSVFERNYADIITFECRKKTLDDLFVAMTGRRLNE